MGDENYRYDYENHPDKLEKNSYFEFPVANDSHPIFERHLQKKDLTKFGSKCVGFPKNETCVQSAVVPPTGSNFFPVLTLKVRRFSSI